MIDIKSASWLSNIRNSEDWSAYRYKVNKNCAIPALLLKLYWQLSQELDAWGSTEHYPIIKKMRGIWHIRGSAWLQSAKEPSRNCWQNLMREIKKKLKSTTKCIDSKVNWSLMDIKMHKFAASKEGECFRTHFFYLYAFFAHSLHLRHAVIKASGGWPCLPFASPIRTEQNCSSISKTSPRMFKGLSILLSAQRPVSTSWQVGAGSDGARVSIAYTSN